MAQVNEDQLCELEALRSIYPTELTVEEDRSPLRLSIRLGLGENSSQDDDDDEEDTAECTLNFELPAEYPEVVPSIELSSDDPDVEENMEEILSKLNELALENIGLPMVFTIASAAQEEVTHVIERMQQKRLEEENRKKLEEEERETRRLIGTPVTVENFLAWKTRFDEEMGRIKPVIDPASKKLNGREQFLKDATLCTSDIRLIEESGEELKIDESLYGDIDLDDTALSDDDSD